MEIRPQVRIKKRSCFPWGRGGTGQKTEHFFFHCKAFPWSLNLHSASVRDTEEPTRACREDKDWMAGPQKGIKDPVKEGKKQHIWGEGENSA